MSDGVHEFDCCECERHVIAFVRPQLPLCATCLMVPGWMHDAGLRKVIGHGYDDAWHAKWSASG